jgi:lipoprotein-anchoring transpeptidase ErfK/SrfK
MDMESAGDEEQTPRREHSTFSLANISALGAVVLAFIAAGSYTYLSRSAAKPPAAAVHAGASAALKPDVSRQATNIKTAEPAAEKPGDAAGGSLPYGMGRQFVFYRSSYPAGTIIINKPQHTLYQVKAETVAIQYSIGIGPACMDAAGMHRVSDRQEWPQWPPAPPGGAAQVASASAGEHRPESRLGARALFLNDIEYGIHGTDKPGAIGRNSSFGCFLLMDDDIADLYDRTPVDTHVVIMN